jgi:hypothetical protein
MSSMQARITAADEKDLNPIIGRTWHLIARWSCSTTLLRYLGLLATTFNIFDFPLYPVLVQPVRLLRNLELKRNSERKNSIESMQYNSELGTLMQLCDRIIRIAPGPSAAWLPSQCLYGVAHTPGRKCQ